jgi:hypothetical protein
MLWRRLFYSKLQIVGNYANKFKQVLDACYVVHFGRYQFFGGNTCFHLQAEEACSYIHAAITELRNGREAFFRFLVYIIDWTDVLGSLNERPSGTRITTIYTDTVCGVATPVAAFVPVSGWIFP